MPNDRLSLKVDLAVTGGAQADAASQSVQRLIDITQRSGATGERAAKRLKEGFEHVVPATTAASGAIQLFEGSIPITAVENFISKTLKAGPILQTAFPIVGAVALTGVIVTAGKELYSFIGKFDTLRDAQERSRKSTKDLAGEFKRLNDEIQRLQDKKLEFDLGKIAALNIRAVTTNAGQAGLAGRERIAMDQIKQFEDARYKLINEPWRSVNLPKIGTDEKGNPNKGRVIYDPDKEGLKALDTDIATLLSQFAVVQQQQQVARMQAADLTRDSILEQQRQNEDNRKKAEDAAKQVADQAKQRQQSVDAYGKSARAYGLGPVELAIQKRDEMLATPGLNAGQRTSITSSFAHEIALALAKIQSDTARQAGLVAEGIGDDQRKSASFGAGLFSKQLQASINNDDEWLTDHAKHLADIRRQDSVEFGGMRDAVNRQVRSAGIDAQPGNALALAQQNYDLTMRELAAEWQRVKAHQDSYNLSIEANRLLNDVNAAEGERNDRFREYLAIQEGGLRRLSGSFLEAAFGGSQGISNFLKSNVERFATGAFENLAGHYSKQILGDGTAAHPGIIPHAKEGTFLGMLLKGLPGGPDQMKSAVDPLKTATTENTTKTGLNTQAVDKLSVALQAYQSGGGAAGVGASGSGLASAIAGALGPLDDLPVSAPGSTANGGRYGSIVGLPAGITDDGKSASGGMSAMGKVGTGAAIVAGGFGAYEGFKSGGAKGGLAGASSILGTAALIDPEPISKAILAGAALVTGFASSMLGDPKQARAAQIQKELDEARYMAPTAISKTVSVDGSYMDRDAMGYLRTSPFSGNPQTTSPYTTWNDGSPYEVPGSVKSPYGPPIIVINHNYQTGAIQAADAKSFGEMLDAHHQAVGDAAAKTLGTGHTLLAQRIQYVQR